MTPDNHNQFEQYLELTPSSLTELEKKLARAKGDGFFHGIKSVIKEMEKWEQRYRSDGYEIPKIFIDLKDELGSWVYPNWPDRREDLK